MPEKRVVPFRQVDVTRAIKGATAGGMPVGRVEISREGTIVILAAETSAPSSSSFDNWKASRNARSS